MKLLFEIKSQSELHHFYLIKSLDFNLNETKKHFTKILAEDFDIFYFNYNSLMVDDAREIIDLANRKISSGRRNLFFIQANSINISAQNSLLKSLEEPTRGLHFFIIIPEINEILPTVLSRAVLINDLSDKVDKSTNTTDQNFLDLKIADKISYVEKLAAEIKDEKKTKQDAVNFADSLIQVLNKDSDFKRNNPQKLSEIINLRSFLLESGSSVKSILEAIVLALPNRLALPKK